MAVVRVCLLALLVFSFSAQAKKPSFENHYDRMAQVTADGRGAIASVNSIATDVGMDILARGGNAVDAATAVAFALGVVDSPNSGIGGGCFILVHWANGKIEAIDGREMAPGKASRDMYVIDGKVDPQLSKTGALAIGIPGSVAALEYFQAKGGKLKWAELIAPAAQIAEQGFPIDDGYSRRLGWTAEHMRGFDASAKIFLDKNGEALKPGAHLVQTDLAKTYRQLAKQGSEYFYQGEFAKKVEAWMKQNNGIVTAEDFAHYRMVLREPVISSFHGYQIVGFPPPSSGGAHVAQILNILDNFPLQQVAEDEFYHYTIEAMKLAFADRAYWMGDPDFSKVPKGIIDPAYGRQLAKKIDPKKAVKVDSHGTPPNADSFFFNRHTTHIATADAQGNWVAITTTLNTSFGSKVTIPGTGVLMNNQMDDFSAQPGTANAFGLLGDEANSIQPGKRPLSSMSPTLVLLEDKPVATIGAAGGPTIINQVVMGLLNRLVFNLPAEQALSRARVHHQWQPDRVLIDAYAPEDVKKSLQQRGHTLQDWPGFGATQMIVREKGKFTAVAEPRLQSR